MIVDYKDLIEEMRAEFDKLEHGVSTRLHALLDALTGHVREAKVDAEQAAHDAEAAAAPVVAEAEHDAEKVAEGAVADATAAVETPKAP